jgi:broad specificity phosphatase PhoE
MHQNIWIARHANRLDFVNPDWFLTAERRYDPPLSDDGIVQAQQLGQRLKGENIAHIFASPFLRTVQTANAVAEALNLSIKLESGLSEWLNPEWMKEPPIKLCLEALAELYPRIDTGYNSRITAIYPETSEQCLGRSGETARRLADEFFPKDILLVGHGASVLGASMGLVARMQKQGIKVPLCSLFKVVRQEPEWVLQITGDTSHLTATEEVIRFN